MKKTIIKYEGQKNTIQGECKPREAMEILGLNPKDWKMVKKEINDKTIIYELERARSLAIVPVETETSYEDNQSIDDEQVQSEIIAAESMEFSITIPRDELQAVLQVIVEIIPKQMMNPALSSVKIVCAEDNLVLSATDLERSFSVSIPSTGTPVAFLVDAVLLAREVKALHKDIEDVILTASGNMVEINGRCALHISNVEEFPTLPEVNGPSVSISNLTAALRSVLPAVNLDQTRYTLTGIYFDFPRGKIVATDGIRLHLENIIIADVPACLVPRQAAVMLHKYQATEVVVSDKYLSASLMGGTFTARFMEGRFPDYAGIIEDLKNEHTAKFQADEFLALVPGVLPVSESSAIDMIINGRIDIKTESSAGSYKWHVPATSDLSGGVTKQIRINCKYIMDAIKAYAESKTITMTFPETYGAITINEKAIIMPIRL